MSRDQNAFRTLPNIYDETIFVQSFMIDDNWQGPKYATIRANNDVTLLLKEQKWNHFWKCPVNRAYSGPKLLQ